MERDEKTLAIKRSVELLKQGATMLSIHCPKCDSPLYKLKSGETVCPVHGRVLVVSRDEELVRISLESILSRLEEKIASRLSLYLDLVEEGNDEEVARKIRLWLDVLEGIRRVRMERRATGEGKSQ
uniref:Sjogrens syndrome scleroderma autoantigen 1 n=1 Tax=Fervidicoccus fontis TaxID=683846 RepID=A0A7J3ZJR5_9CREN